MHGQLDRMVELLSAYSSAVLTERLLEETTAGELTPAQYDALTFMHRHPGKSAKDLSEGLRISIPSATRLVDRLVSKELVDRRESGVDRRLVELSTTPAGEEMLAAVERTRVALLQHALGALQPQEQQTLLHLLGQFLRVVLCDVRTVQACCRHCGTVHDADCVVNEMHIALAGGPVERP